MKKILFLTLIPFLIFPQFSTAKRDLAETTFYRQFDKEIIKKYLSATRSDSVAAALLSISHSDDQSFIDDIIKLNFQNHWDLICFSLGQLGESEKSTTFLINKIKNDSIPLQVKDFCIRILGLVGNKEAYKWLVNFYGNNSEVIYPLLPAAFYNFFVRKIGDINEIKSILYNELEKNNVVYSSFALDRIGISKNERPGIVKYLKREYSKENPNSTAIYFLLGSLRRSGYFPDDLELYNNVISANNFTVNVEVARTLCYYNYKDIDMLNRYFNLLTSPNANVSRQTAFSISELKLTEDLKDILKVKIEDLLSYQKLTEIAAGELLISYTKLFDVEYSEVVDKFMLVVPNESLYRVAGAFNKNEDALQYLIENYDAETLKNKITILQEALKFRQNFMANNELQQLLLNALSSDSPPLISIAADGVDSALVYNHFEFVQNTTMLQINEHLNDPQFLESIMSLNTLSKKIGEGFDEQVAAVIKSSKVPSIKNIVSGNHNKVITDAETELFNNIWERSFKYSAADITTENGSFTIEFKPGIAPISVGNFCYLAEQDYYNNIIFHRVVPGFVIQAGDPTGTGWGGPDYSIISEYSPFDFTPGVVGMASAGKDTEGSQWFVTTGYFPHLTGRYTIFGNVNKGMETIYNIKQNDKILDVTLR